MRVFRWRNVFVVVAVDWEAALAAADWVVVGLAVAAAGSAEAVAGSSEAARAASAEPSQM
jgi:hypothetical protein